MFHPAFRALGPMMAFLIVTSCQLKSVLPAEKGRDGRELSIFQRYSGRYCSLHAANRTKIMEINCEDVENFIDADATACQHDGVRRPQYAYFPDQKRPMLLCREKPTVARLSNTTIRFLVFGDTGVGNEPAAGKMQGVVAQAMHAICPPSGVSTEHSRPCDFAIVLGDLVYPSGIASVWDSQLEEKFEGIYSEFGAMPFYLVPGNHDYQGSVGAMVDYSLFSERWVMPATHFTLPDLPPWLTIAGLDSTAMLQRSAAADSISGQIDQLHGSFCQSSGWKLLFGHHPPDSFGTHSGNDIIAAVLADLHATCPFNAYFSGHDHHQEHLHNQLYDVFLQGAGGAPTHPVDLHPLQTFLGDARYGRGTLIQRFATDHHGFAVVEASPQEMTVYYFDIDVWNSNGDAFRVPPSFDDHVYRCHAQQGDASGCLPVFAADTQWLR